jgi:hypothetical protein
MGLLVIPAFAAGEPAYLVVNGGNSPDSNYAWHERAITSFNQGLFRGQAQILNAGGPATLYVKVDEEGYVLRDRNGDAMYGTSELQGVRPESASRANILRVVDEMRRSDPSKVTVVYDDHGNRQGVSTWESSNLTAADIRRMTDAFPASTYFRSVHMHCNSGAAMVDPDRVVPATLPAFHDFVRKHYNPNVCAVGMSDADELAEYFSMERWPRNNWRNVFLRHPSLSLSQLKGVFRAEPASLSTPLLTSDYLVRDLSTLLCGFEGDTAPVSEAEGQVNGHSAAGGVGDAPMALRIGTAQKAALCDSTSLREVESLTRTIVNDGLVYSEAKQVRRLASREYVEQTWPALVEAYNAAKARIREIKARARAEARSLSDAEDDEIKSLTSGPMASYELKIENVDASTGFKEFFRGYGRRWMAENAEKYPALHARISLPENQAKTVPTILRESGASVDRAKLGRKRASRLAEAGQRAALKAWLESADGPLWIKELYDGLQRCEASPLY